MSQMTNTLYKRPQDYDEQYLDYNRDLPFWVWAAENYGQKNPD